MENQIQLIQTPVIKHDLKAVGQSVTQRIEALNIENQIATVDTIQAMKRLMAELNKEAKSFEDQRKAVKNAINFPYVEFEKVYKEEVISKITNAVNILKDKIGVYEIELKDATKATIERYFAELCQVEKIDFVKFDQTGIKINLSTTDKKYKEQCNEFILKVQDDIKLIETEEFQAEIMAEYKTTLNASAAITAVRDRKKREKEEQERILQQRTLSRENKLEQIGMYHEHMIKAYTYIHDDSIVIKKADIVTMSDGEFMKVSIEAENKINAYRAAKTAEEKAKLAKEQGESVKETPVQVPEPQKPFEAPKEVKEEIICEATFKARGTVSQLKSIGAYMRANNIPYDNLD